MESKSLLVLETLTSHLEINIKILWQNYDVYKGIPACNMLELDLTLQMQESKLIYKCYLHLWWEHHMYLKWNTILLSIIHYLIINKTYLFYDWIYSSKCSLLYCLLFTTIKKLNDLKIIVVYNKTSSLYTYITAYIFVVSLIDSSHSSSRASTTTGKHYSESRYVHVRHLYSPLVSWPKPLVLMRHWLVYCNVRKLVCTA